MDRSSQHEALILHMWPVGDIHASVDLLTRHGGLIRATAYGARSMKGSLRGKVVPFATGTAYRYYQPNRDAYKITDYDVADYHLGIQDDLRSYYAASMIAEIVRRTFAGGGDTEEHTYALVHESLTWLNTVGTMIRGQGGWNNPSTQVLRLVSLFMWRYLEVLGLQPVPESIDEERRGGYGSVGQSDPPANLPPGVFGYLRGTARMPITEAVQVQLESRAIGDLYRALVDLIQGAVQGEIKSLSMLNGVL